MALDPEVEALIALLPAAEQQGMRDRLNKGYLRQEDYSRLMNESQAAQARADARYKANEEWWNNTGADAWKAAEARNAELAAKNAELEEQVRAAATGARGQEPIDAGQLDARVKAEIDRRGYMSKADTEALVKQIAAQTRQEAEEQVNKNLPFQLVWSQDMAYARIKYEQDFGKPLPREEFAKFMTERNLAADPIKALSEFTAPERQKKETDSLLEKARAEERDRVMKEMAGKGMPGNAGVGAGDGSPAVRHIKGDETGGFVLPKGSRLGNGEAAAAAAARLIANGKF